MGNIKVTGLIAIMFLAATFQVAAQNWQIVPGRSVALRPPRSEFVQANFISHSLAPVRCNAMFDTHGKMDIGSRAPSPKSPKWERDL